jgi:L-threonylcarbamoyladenylate synthase
MNAKLQDRLVSLDEAVEILLKGGVGIIPTDTVYGLVARVQDKKAFSKFYQTKKRDKLGITIAANVRQLLDLGVDPKYITRAEKWWPAPLTLIMPTKPVLRYFHGPQSFRVVDDVKIGDMLKKTGPLITTSANQPDRPVSENIEQAWNYFGESVDFYVDGGNFGNREPSTVVRMLPDGAEILRQGAFRPK